MSHKAFTKGLLVIVILLASFTNVGSAYANSTCGATVTVQWGDTLSHIAQLCNTTVAAIYAANPGLGYYIYPGQVLIMPGGGYSSTGSYTASSYSNTYYVQPGDTFASIASRYGVSVNALWAANPQIYNINWIYAGQVIYVPGSSGYSSSGYSSSGSSSSTTSSGGKNEPELSYGYAGEGYATSTVKMTNNANADVYVSLQGTTIDGVTVINEYSVVGTIRGTVPVGWYSYVVWAGGKKFSGGFLLRDGGNVRMTIFPHKVNVDY